VVGIEYVDPTKDGSLIIGRATAVKTTGLLISGQFEGRIVPTVRELRLIIDPIKIKNKTHIIMKKKKKWRTGCTSK
jgi:hypothetical protein